MKIADASILIVPGLGGSGEDHWQTRWLKRLSSATLVSQDDWHHAMLPAWRARLLTAVADSPRPVLFIAHSLGACLVGQAAAEFGTARIAGAYLVAPPSAAGIASEPGIDAAFAAPLAAPLAFPALLVASRDDPHATLAESEAMAAAWGATLIDAGPAGHINSDSGHGPWPEGLMSLAHFMGRI